MPGNKVWPDNHPTVKPKNYLGWCSEHKKKCEVGLAGNCAICQLLREVAGRRLVLKTRPPTGALRVDEVVREAFEAVCSPCSEVVVDTGGWVIGVRHELDEANEIHVLVLETAKEK